MTAFQSFFAEHEDPDVPFPAKARIDGALTVRYVTGAAEERQAADKDTGTTCFEILRPGVHYHPEDAGSMQDGTPLVAVFECDPRMAVGVDEMAVPASSFSSDLAGCGGR